MKLLGLCALFQLLPSFSSSRFCSIQYPQPYKNEPQTWNQKQHGALRAPWLVNIIGNGRKCQGVVLNNWWVLTAANCFRMMKPSHVEVTGARGRFSTITVSQFLLHQGFSSWNAAPNNDLGLVLLSHPLDLRRGDLWPVCVPHKCPRSSKRVQCIIIKRGQYENTRWQLKGIFMYVLLASECDVHWSGTTEKLNLCLARMEYQHVDCRVPVGSPVMCHEPSSKKWEVMGLVSQSLHNCTAPVLAVQLAPHLQWLWQEGAVNYLQTQCIKTIFHRLSFPARTANIKYPTDRQAEKFEKIWSMQTSQQILLATPAVTRDLVPMSLQVPVVLPDTGQVFELSTASSNAALALATSVEQTSTKATSPLNAINPLETRQSSPVVNEVIFVASPTISQLTPSTSTTIRPMPQTTPAIQVMLVSEQVSITPTTSPTVPDTPTARQSQHVIIIPAPTRPLASPDSATEPPEPLPVVFVAGPPVPKSKRDKAPFPPDPFLRLLAPPSAPIVSNLEPSVKVTVEQCGMRLTWNSNSQTYQLKKMAILKHRKVGCGLRPGFVPKCPSCLEAEVGEFPWIVSLMLSIQHFCAGSILNPWWILTTASCANHINNLEDLALVQAGLVDASKGLFSVPIRQALIHPHSLVSQDLHNLGLLQLEKPLEFGPHVAPICLSDKADTIGDFRNCWLPGWTVLEGGSTMLLRHPLDILSISSCNQLGEQFSNAIFCIKAQRGQGGVCKGDVGSPLICPDPQSGAWLQLGVLSSFDEACLRPYVFSSLSHYLPWLESTTKSAGQHYNLMVPWERWGPAKKLRLLQKPETLVKWISARLSLPWQVLIATCGNRSCEGSILDRYWVLTTRQCVQEADPANTTVFVGLTHPNGYARGIRVAKIYPYESIQQYSLSGGFSVALLLLQKPITFGQYVTPMTFSPVESWDNCKVMGLQMLQSGDVGTDPSAYQAKVLLPSECGKERPGINSTVYCIVRNISRYHPVAAVGEGAALLCPAEAKSTWSQVGLMSEPFPGSQPVVLSSSIASYVDWMEETSKQAKHLLSLTSGSTACGPSRWVLLLILSLLWAAELG